MASTRSTKTARRKAAPRKRAAKARDAAAGPLDPGQGVATFRRALRAGEPWYPALLNVIGRWLAPEETVDGVHYRYLIAGEAFDWLRLAQRLLEAAGDLAPEEAAERLLLFGLTPDGSDDEDFARAIGQQKHRAHLNFQYGVIVEEALLLSAEHDLQKAGALAGSRDAMADVAAYERVYGRPFEELLGMYRTETEATVGEEMSLAEMQAFTYWCSKFRFRTGEPARVASDTRKALALLSTMEPNRARLGGLTADGAREVVVEG